ncbi:hypothetical protein NPX13_g7806 [Xylaria arbuscula]|uniref:Glycolipid transfer protein domain-containing protein n=1 Tax=Xylaria arbuscula TaxID=114810 RepID=A0A9W8N9X3_9PEZI|nr:hypothetical protein NPX13_g7806 [Xylaria arbuscula]
MSTPIVPEGATLLSTFKRSFVDVPIDADNDNAISTTEFLDAAESLTTMFDALGSVAFSPVKSDMLGNVKKIRERQLAAPAESENLQALVINELKSKSHKATEGLVWLVRLSLSSGHLTGADFRSKRGLDFTCIALSSNLAKGTEELADSFRGAYGATLKPHHGFLVKPVFSAAMSACPYRKDFYPKLGSDQTAVTVELTTYLKSLEKIVAILKGFQDRKEAKCTEPRRLRRNLPRPILKTSPTYGSGDNPPNRKFNIDFEIDECIPPLVAESPCSLVTWSGYCAKSV